MAAKAASGDALLVLSDGAQLRVHALIVSLESPVLATAVQLAMAQPGREGLLEIPLLSTSHSEAALLVCALYARDLPGLLDGLPADWVLELAAVSHRFACCEVLQEADRALVRKCSSSWLSASSAVSVLRMAEARGLSGLQTRLVEYVSEHMAELPLDSEAAGDSLVMVLQHLRRKRAKTSV